MKRWHPFRTERFLKGPTAKAFRLVNAGIAPNMAVAYAMVERNYTVIQGGKK